MKQKIYLIYAFVQPSWSVCGRGLSKQAKVDVGRSREILLVPRTRKAGMKTLGIGVWEEKADAKSPRPWA